MDDILVALVVGRIVPYPGFLSVQQVRQHHGTAYTGGRRRHAVHQLGLVVHADVRLHAKVPLVAFPGLPHFQVTPASQVLGGGECIDSGAIHNGAGGKLEPPDSK